ncbi:hypothetical protein SSAG_02655 [Streptomyces sp. Mg1]|nr:hypothetical protein SSAG_02655 [Streptomyces sp. Mg1]
MRGAARPNTALTRYSGVIPAGAGSSRITWEDAWESGGHPRGCGEQRIRQGALGRDAGSSPRVRGAALGVGLPYAANGVFLQDPARFEPLPEIPA